MKLLVNGVLYDSTKVPVLIAFDENEKDLFNGMKKFVSGPPDMTEYNRAKLMNVPLEKLACEHTRVTTYTHGMYAYTVCSDCTVHTSVKRINCEHINVIHYNRGNHGICQDCGEEL